MPPETLIADLRKALAPDRVLTDPADLFVYDADGLTIARARPAAVVFPQSTAEVAKVVKLLAHLDVPIVPRGAGTGLAGGCIAFANGVVVSTARMTRILKIDPANRVAHVEAGVRNTALTDAVALLPGGSDYHFSPDPSSQRASTIGGNAATNAGGIHVLKDFVTSNHVLGVEMVLADGTVLTCGGKDGAYESGNFDLPGLLCGSEGTLGIITKLWVRLTPKPAAFRTLVSIFSTTADAGQFVADVIRDGHLPAAMEMLDGAMVKVIEDAYQFGFPADAQSLVLTEIDGIDALLDRQMDQIVALSKRNRAAVTEASADPDRRAKLWKMRKSAFGAIGRISTSFCTQDACVPRSKLPEVLAKIIAIGEQYGLKIPNVFHAGDGNVHPILLYDERDPQQVRNVLAASEAILKYCVDVGGTITGEHGVGVEKLHLMPYCFDPATMKQMDRVKRAFDPGERLNAGKLIPTDKITVELGKPGRQVPQ
jgi:glycolate oxidase